MMFRDETRTLALANCVVSFSKFGQGIVVILANFCWIYGTPILPWEITVDNQHSRIENVTFPF